MDKFYANIYVTEDYNQFHILNNNRDVKNDRVNKIKKSINEIGVIPAPIVINEKYEVIDGQGRLEACKQLNKPVYYTIIRGLGINECTKLNAYSTNCPAYDYINSYSGQGNKYYSEVKKLINEYPRLNLTNILICLCHYRPKKTSLENGLFTFDLNELPETKKLLDFMCLIEKNCSNLVINKESTTAIEFLWHHPDVDMKRVYKCFSMLEDNYSFSKTTSFLSWFENIYNKGLRANNCVYFATDYKKKLRRNK